jgi:hypothetical protein
MLDLIGRVQEYAQPASILIVEANEEFDFATFRAALPESEQWDVRAYAPAVVGVWRA